MGSKRTPRILMAAILALFAASKIPLLSIPYHWDEMGYVATLCHYYYETGFYPIAHLETYGDPLLRRLSVDSGHPPLFYLTVAALWRLFGPAPWVPRALTLALALLAIASTYALGARLLDPRYGVAAAAALAANPLFFAQGGTAHLDLPLAALVVASFAALAASRLSPFLVVGTVMMLVKAQAVLFQPAITGYLLVRARSRRRSGASVGTIGKELALWHLPVGGWLFWKVWFVLDTGTLVTQNAYNTQPLRTAHELLRGTIRSVYFGLVHRGSFFFTALALLGALALWKRRTLRAALTPEVGFLLALPIVTVIGVQAPLRNNGARYFVATLPLLVLLGLVGLRGLGASRTRAILAAVLPAIAFEIVAWWGTDPLLRVAEGAGLVRVASYKDAGSYWSGAFRLRVGDEDQSDAADPRELAALGASGSDELSLTLRHAPRAGPGAPVVVSESVGAEVAGELYTWGIFEGRLDRLAPSAEGLVRIFAKDPRGPMPAVPERKSLPNDSHENTLDYLEAVRLHQRAMRWIEDHRPGARLLSNWPGLFEAKYPYLGYVKVALPVIYLAPIVDTVKPEDFDLLYASEDAMFPDMHHAVVRRLRLAVVQEFEGPFGRVVLYEPPERAKTSPS